MGMGLAALGTAVGGFAKGYMEGEKHRSDLEDADARRGLLKIQTEKGQLELDEARDQRALRDKSRAIVSRYLPLIGGEETPGDGTTPAATAPTPTVANPAAQGTEAPVAGGAEMPVQQPAPVRPAGIATPGERATPVTATSAKPAMNRFDALQKMYTELNMAGLTANPQNWEKSLETALSMGRKFNDAKTDASIRALQSYNGSNDQEVIQALAQAGINLPEGTKLEKTKTEAFPNSGMFFDDVKATSPDGKQTVTMGQLMRNRLDPKEWMSINNELGYKAADLTIKRHAEQNLDKYRMGMLEQRGIEVQATIEKYKNDNRVAMARLEQIAEERKDAATARALKDRQSASDTALDSLLKGFGINKTMKETDLAMLPKDQQAKIRQNLATAFTAHSLWEMNVTPDNKQTFAPSEAPNVLKQIMGTDAKDFQIDSGGVFTEYRGKKVYAPIDPNAVRAAQGEKVETPAPSPNAPQVGAARPDSAPGSAPVVTPAAGIRVDPSALPANPRERGIAIQQQAQQQQAASNAQFASEVSKVLQTLTPRQAVQIQSDSRFSSLPMDVRAQIFKVANQR